MKLWALPLTHQRKPVPPAQPGGFAACQPWKQWWGWDRMGWDGVRMLKPGNLAHCSAPREPQPPPALAAVPGTGRVPG